MDNEPQTKPQAVSASAITPKDMPKPTAPAEHTAAPVAEKAAAPVVESNVEKDARGVPFDPACHLNKKHPVSGRWMPKGGRKKKVKGATSDVSTSQPSSSEKSAGSGSTTTPPPSASFIPDEKSVTGQADATGSKSQPAPDARAEIVDHADDAAEVVTRGAQFGAGLVFDDPDAGKVTDGEHQNMRKATAAYIRTKGWQASAGVALALVFVAWFLRIVNKPGPQAKVKSWLSIGREPAAAASPSKSETAPKETTHNVNGVPPLAT